MIICMLGNRFQDHNSAIDEITFSFGIVIID
jgi:hypothetical protein